MGKRNKQSAQRRAQRDRRADQNVDWQAEHRAAEARREQALRDLETARLREDEAVAHGYQRGALEKDSGRRARDKSYAARSPEAIEKYEVEQRRRRHESEAILEELPGTTIPERLDSARRGLFIEKPEPSKPIVKTSPAGEPQDPRFKRKVYRCGCGFTGALGKVNKHQRERRFRGEHLTRRDVTVDY